MLIDPWTVGDGALVYHVGESPVLRVHRVCYPHHHTIDDMGACVLLLVRMLVNNH